MTTLLLTILVLAALPTCAVGLLVFFHVARPQRAPADASNRINKLRLLWFALTREDQFVSLFPWLARDEMGNVRGEGEP